MAAASEPVVEYWDDASLPRDSLSRAAERLRNRGSMYLGGGVGVERDDKTQRYSVIGGGSHPGALSAITQALTLAGSKSAEGTPGGTAKVTDPAIAARLFELDAQENECNASILRMRRSLARNRKDPQYSPYSSGGVVGDDLRWEQRRINELTEQLKQIKTERRKLMAAKTEAQVQEAWSAAARAAALLSRKRNHPHVEATPQHEGKLLGIFDSAPVGQDHPLMSHPGDRNGFALHKHGPDKFTLKQHGKKVKKGSRAEVMQHYVGLHNAAATQDSPMGAPGDAMGKLVGRFPGAGDEAKRKRKSAADKKRVQSLDRSREAEEEVIVLGEAAEVGKPGTNFKQVAPQDRKKINPIVKHYMKMAHPFTACVRDNRKRFGERAERVCAVVKDMGEGTTKWRKGSKRVKEQLEESYVDRLLEASGGDVLGVEAMFLAHVLETEADVSPKGGLPGADAEEAARKKRRRARREAVLGRTTAGTPGDVDAGGFGVSEAAIFAAD